MLKHRMALAAVTICMMALLVAGAITPAPAQAAVVEISKVTLGETSIDAPAFFSTSGAFQGTPYSTVIAWTGTDQRLNVMTSTDGLHYGHKITLNEFAAVSPSVVQLSNGAVVLAWIGSGTDTAHHVNVLYNVYGTQKKVTLTQTSIGTPALAVFKGSQTLNGNLTLAWTGTDPNHSLNVMGILLTSDAFGLGPKNVLSRFSSNAGPSLQMIGNAVVLGWATKTTHLNFASSSDGATFTSALGDGLVQLSTAAPVMYFHESEGGPSYWIAWTGTDPAHYLNLQWTSRYPQWPDPAHTKTVLGETALGGVGLAFNDGRVIAWTGTDPAHHLNVARLDLF